MRKMICLLLAAMCVLLAACGSGQTGVSAETEPVKIETPFGALSYPAEWADSLVTEQTQEGDRLAVDFRADVAGETFDLFRVTISPEEGDSVGTLKDADGTERNVFIEVFELDADGLTAADQDTLYAMQEGVNTLIDALS